MQHPLATRPDWPQDDETNATTAAAASAASNLLGLVSRANFLPPLHRPPQVTMESFAEQRPKFLPNPGDKDFFRIKSQLEHAAAAADAVHHSNNNKFVFNNTESKRNSTNDYEVKSKLFLHSPFESIFFIGSYPRLFGIIHGVSCFNRWRFVDYIRHTR